MKFPFFNCSVFSILFFILFANSKALHAQCPIDLLYGQNIVQNPGFENGYASWSFDPNTAPSGTKNGYVKFVSAPSFPADIYVGTNAVTFNAGFTDFADHTPTADDLMLMVDGICQPNIDLWQQTVTVSPSTNYYFSVWVHTLKDFAVNDSLGTLRFTVAGAKLGSIKAPRTLAQGWIQFETVWNSGATSGNVVISMENTTLVNCDTKIDFAIDDIAFIPGCAYGALGTVPNLGPDQSFCGKGGSITLNSNITPAATTTVSWSDNTTATGLGAAYSKVITAPGTYSVCVTENGSCVKSDVIVITNTITTDIGANVNLCTVNSTTMDAGFSGPTVTYQWYKNFPTLAPGPNIYQTYSANSAGTYRVDVSAPGCVTASSSKIVSSTNSGTPTDAYYCGNGATPTLSIAGSGTYSWYDASTAGTLKTTGLTYTLPAIANNPATQTYYVDDVQIYSGGVGPTSEFTSGTTAGNSATFSNFGQHGLFFSPTQNFRLNSVSVPVKIVPKGAGTPMPITITLGVYTSAGAAVASITSTSATVNIPGTTTGFNFYTFSFTGFNIPVSLGTNLVMKIVSTTTGAYAAHEYEIGTRNSLTSSPYIYNSTIPELPGVVSITGAFSNNSATSLAYFGLYDWNISATTPCSRVPVRAISTCPLPVSWLSFDAETVANNACRLVWSTATETNNKYFSIERTSDGSKYEVIGTINASGDKLSNTNYSFVDSKPLPGISYYRIVQYDFSGEGTSTGLREFTSVKSSANFQIKTYPNPYDESSILQVTGGDQQSYKYRVYSISGQLLKAGSANFQDEVSIGLEFPKGMYLLDVIVEKQVNTVKLVKN